jgi:multidrug efflux system membrane fusion protein
VVVVLLLGVLVGGYVLYTRQAKPPGPAGQGGGPRSGPAAARAIPVLTGRAKRGDLPIYLTGLGTVTPLANVVVRSRVDGQLMHIGFVEGQMVKAGDVIAEIDPRPFAAALKQVEGQLLKDQAVLDNARIDLKRYQDGGDIFSDQQTATQQAFVKQNQGIVESDQGLVDNARLQLDYCRIVAPTNGRIGLRTVDEGNMVHASDTTGLAVITVLQPITVIFTIGQDDIPSVLTHMASDPHLEVDAYSRDLSKRLAMGTLSAIDNQVDPGSGTVRLRARFDNADHQLFPNQFVNVRLLIDTQHGVILVPTAAVQLAPDGNFVYVVGQDSTVSVRKVTTGASEEGLTIVDGIAMDDVVVTDGVDKLQAGTKVQTRAPANGGAHDAAVTGKSAPATGTAAPAAGTPDHQR